MGNVTQHDVTRFGLHRILIELGNESPEVALWTGLIPEDFQVLAQYVFSNDAHLPLYFLWIFCKVRKDKL
jgi:hypothetical protein